MDKILPLLEILLLSSLVLFVSSCGNNKPLTSFTLPANEILTTENHSADWDTSIIPIFGQCAPQGGTGSIGRIFRIPKGEMIVGWDRQFRPDDCHTSIVEWYRGAVRFNLDELNRALKGRDPVSIELLFSANGSTFEHRNGEIVGTSNTKNMLCMSQMEIATDPWPDWQLGTRDTINGSGSLVNFPEGEMRNVTEGGLQETATGQFKINVTRVFKEWRSGDTVNLGFMFRSDQEQHASDIQANDGCLTTLSHFAIRVWVVQDTK